MSKWFLLDVAGHQVGVSAGHVRELLKLNACFRPAWGPKNLRGLVKLRERLLPAWDVRKLLGFSSRVEEQNSLEAMLLQRKQDHIDWLTELRKSVDEAREFKKTTDPHACAFGKWYDQYQAPDSVLAVQMLKFDAPHKRIHAVGKAVRALADKGEYSQARELIEATWEGDLAGMLRLFDETIPLFRSIGHEIVVVTQHENRALGLIVDDVADTCELDDDLDTGAADWDAVTGSSYFKGFGRFADKPFALIDIPNVFQRLGPSSNTG